MTENRFDYTNYDDGTESIYDREKDEYYFDAGLSRIEELLNELDGEIKELEIEYRRLARFLMKNGYTISDYLKYCEENEFNES